MIHIGETSAPDLDGQAYGAYIFAGEISEAAQKRFADSLDGHQAVVDTQAGELVVRPPLAEEASGATISLSPNASRLAMGLGWEMPPAETIQLPSAAPEAQDIAA